MIKKYFVVKAIIILVLLLSHSYISNAQDFEVAPVIIHFNMEPGQSANRNVTITNHNNVKTSFSLKIIDFICDDQGSKVFVAPNSHDLSAASMLNVSPNFIDINPGESAEIMVTYIVPNGDYSTRWAAIAVQPVVEQTAFTADKNVATVIKVSGRIIIEIYQSPESNKNYAANIKSFKEVTKTKDRSRSFRLAINNTGQKLIKGKIYMIATNMETGEETTFNTNKTTILPNANRFIDLYLNKELPTGQYSLAAILDYGSAASLEGAQIMIDVE